MRSKLFVWTLNNIRSITILSSFHSSLLKRLTLGLDISRATNGTKVLPELVDISSTRKELVAPTVTAMDLSSEAC